MRNLTLKFMCPSKRVTRLSRQLLVFTLIIILFSWPPTSRVRAAAGDLDFTFGSGGKVTTNFFGSDSIDIAHSLVILNDGKILVAGNATASTPGFSQTALARYNADGSLDASFGTAGKVISQILEGSTGLALQGDGKIIVGGDTFNSSTRSDFGVARFNADGSLDTSFGTAGKATADFFGSQDFTNTLAIQSDGKVVVGGYALHDITFIADFALARFNADGSLDTSFGTAGKVTTDFFGLNEQARAIAFQSDGKIVAAGFAQIDQFNGSFALARYNVDGSLDTSFGTAGKVTTNVSKGFGPGSFANAVAIQSDGKIVAGGGVSFLSFALARYNADGSLDASFGTAGEVITDFGNNADYVNDLIIQSNGKIVAAGGATFDFGLARYNTDGSLDTSFGTAGKVITDFSNDNDEVSAIGIQSDGRIVAAGFSANQATSFDFALARYNGDGVIFDMCLQDDSNGNLLLINTSTGGYQFTNCGGVTIGGTGIITRRGGVVNFQHNATDRRIVASVDTSSQRATASVQLLSQGRTFNIIDRNITNNTCACR